MSSTIVKPAAVGTHRFSARIDAAYTCGRDHVGAALEMLLRRTDVLSMDIETFGLGLEARKLKSVSFGVHNYAVVLDPRDPLQFALILDTVKRARLLVTHNGGYDVINMHLNGLFPIECIDKVIDTIIYSRMAEPSDIGGHDLFAVAKSHGGFDSDVDNQLPKAFKALAMSADNGWRAFDIDRPIYLQGAAADVIVTARVYPELLSAAYYQTTRDHPFVNHGVTGQEALDLIEREQVVNRVLLKRSCRGVVVDLEYLDRYRAQHSQSRQETERELEKIGVEPGNSDALVKWMVDNNQLPADYPRVGKTQKLSGQAKHVERIPHPVARMFIAHKKALKIEKDYLVKCETLSICGPDGLYRVFPGTAVLKAATGRAAMSDPPLHQFNGPARGILMADPGDALVSIDWSAIEPVLVANLAGEASMYTHYETFYGGKVDRDTGEVEFNLRAMDWGDWGDMYEGIADATNIKRKAAKIVLLAQLYGEGIPKLSTDLTIELGLPYTKEAAQKLRDDIFSNIPHIQHYVAQMKDIARRHQKIMTLSGRIIPIPWGTFNGEYSIQAHKGVNYSVQGGAYDILANTVLEAERAGIADGIYWTMHDELICSIEIAHELQQIMQTPPDRLCQLSGRVPMLRTDLAIMGERWTQV